MTVPANRPIDALQVGRNVNMLRRVLVSLVETVPVEVSCGNAAKGLAKAKSNQEARGKDS